MPVYLLHMSDTVIGDRIANKQILIPPGEPFAVPEIDESEVNASAGPVRYHMTSEQVASKILEHFGSKFGIVRVKEIRDGYNSTLDTKSAINEAKEAWNKALNDALTTYIKEAQEDARANRAPQAPSGLAKKAVEHFGVDLGTVGIKLIGAVSDQAKERDDEIRQLRDQVAQLSKAVLAATRPQQQTRQ